MPRSADRKRQPLCTAPWYRLLCFESRPQVCCYLTTGFNVPELPASRRELVELYNHEELVTLRERLCTGDIANTPCESCIREGRHHKDIPDFPLKESKAFHDLLQRARDSFAQGETRLDYTPFDLAFSVGTKCNLRCIMCRTSDGVYDLAENAPYSSEQIIDFCKAVGADLVGQLHLFGGEPFFVKDSIRLINTLADLNSDVTVNIVTNGTRIHHHLDALERIRHLSLGVSIDAVGRNYESIRRGAKWDKTLENLRLLAERHKVNPGWEVGIGAVVMRTSLPDMPKVAALARDLGFGLSFNAIRGAYPTENVFAFPHLLKGIPWRAILDETREILRDLDPVHEGHLNVIREGLEAAESGNPMARIYGNMGLVEEWKRWLTEKLEGRPCALFGMSDRMMSLLNACNGNGRQPIAAVSDILCTAETDILSIPYTTPDRIRQYADTVVLTCDTSRYFEYREYLRSRFPELTILPLPEYTPDEFTRMTKLAETLASRPVVGFCTGGFSSIMLESSPLQQLDLRAFSDNNDRNWNRDFHGKTVIPPEAIPEHARDVVIFSRQYAIAIRNQLQAMFGDAVTVHLPFPNIHRTE